VLACLATLFLSLSLSLTLSVLHRRRSVRQSISEREKAKEKK
jgi:preprotein translocase subunit SecG